MGGCASRPKDLDLNEPAPVQAPAVEKTETEPIAQENNGGEETKTEEPLVDLSEPTAATTETAESKPAEEVAEVTEAKTEEKVEAEEAATTEAVTEAKVEAVAEAKAEAVTEVKGEVSSPAEVVVTSEPVKEEVKPVEAQKPEEKSDAPVVTV